MLTLTTQIVKTDTIINLVKLDVMASMKSNQIPFENTVVKNI